MKTIININDYKNIKKASKMIIDLEKSLIDFQKCLDILKYNKRYVTVMESLSTLSTSYKITQIQIEKCKQFLEKNNVD